MPISVKIDTSGFDDLIKQIENLPKWYEEKADEFVKKLAKYGVKVGNREFKQATYAGTNDVKVTWDKDGKGSAIIRATGKTVLFIEFGTGIHMPDAEEARADIVSGDVVRHGEYRKKRGRNKRGWYYPLENGLGENPPLRTEKSSKLGGTIHTYGNPANASFYLTKIQMEQKIADIAKEVFKP